MKENLTCPICGKPTRIYMGNARKDGLCAKHADELKSGKLMLDKNGNYVEVGIKKRYTELPSEGFDNCVNCNKKSKGYAFCKECWKDFTEEEMLNMLNGVEVKKKDTTCVDGYNLTQKEDVNNVVVVNEQNKSKCITCGKVTDGLLFCSNCYFKYKDKELLFKITNCSNIELLDGDYEGRYTCKDGHIVFR